MTEAVGVVFSPGGKVYSFDPGGLELAWNTKVICQTSRGQELGRVVKPNHELDEEPPLPVARAADHVADGEGPGPADELGTHHGALRAPPLLPGLRAPDLQELP